MTHRVTRTSVHTLIDTASEPAAPARVTRHSAHILFLTTDAPAPARVTRQSVHILALSPTRLNPVAMTGTCTFNAVLQSEGAPAADVFVTELSAQALVFAPEGEIGVRVSQLGAEVLDMTEDTSVRVSQLGAEVLLVPEFAELCPTYPVVFKLRIEDDGGDLLTVTSYSDGGALIAEAPRVDGQTFDPLTGKTTIGQANVLVIDATQQPCSDGGTYDYRYVTAILADASGNSQLLGKKAFIEIARDLTTLDYQPYFAGYITGITLVDGTTYEISLAHTTRDDETTKVWATSDYPYATSASALVGGPTFADVPSSDGAVRRQQFQGYWKATVQGIYTHLLHLDIDEDDCAGFPPKDIGNRLEEREIFGGNNSTQRNIFEWAQGLCQQYFVRGFPDGLTPSSWTTNPTGKPAVRGYMPRLNVAFTEKNGDPIDFVKPMMASYERDSGDTYCWENLGNHFYVYWPSANTDGLQTGDQLSFALIPQDVSELAPLWVTGHPVDILSDLLTFAGYTVNGQTAAKTGMGDFLLALRITEPMTVADASKMLCAAFGLGVSYNDDGTRTIFCWRSRRVPVATITLDDLTTPSSAWWKTEEQSRVFSAEWKFKRYEVWPGLGKTSDSLDDRAADGIIEVDEDPLTFQSSVTQPAGTRTESYDVDGTLLSSAGYRLDNTRDVCAVWADQIFGVYFNGAIITEIEVFHELLDGVIPKIGDEVVLDLAARPGIDSTATPTAQRGIAEQCLVIGREPMPSGYKLTLMAVPYDVPPPEDDGAFGSEPGSLDPSFTAAKGAGSYSTNTVVLTLDNDTGWEGFTLDVQYLVNPASTPTTSTEGTNFIDGWSPPAPLNLAPLPNGFPPGSTVWVRVRQTGFTQWTPWQSVTLDPAQSIASAGTVQTPTLQLTVDGSGDVDVTALAGAEAVKVYAAASDTAFPSSATILAGSTDTSPPFTFNNIINIDRGETAYIGVIAEDTYENTSIPTFAQITRSPAIEEALNVVFAGGISTSDFRDIQVPYACEVLGWTILGDTSGSIVVDVWRDTVANFPPTVGDSIAGTGKPTATSATYATGNVTGWSSTALVKDDILRFNVDSVTSFTQVTVSLTVRRT